MLLLLRHGVLANETGVSGARWKCHSVLMNVRFGDKLFDDLFDLGDESGGGCNVMYMFDGMKWTKTALDRDAFPQSLI